MAKRFEFFMTLKNLSTFIIISDINTTLHLKFTLLHAYAAQNKQINKVLYKHTYSVLPRYIQTYMCTLELTYLQNPLNVQVQSQFYIKWS